MYGFQPLPQSIRLPSVAPPPPPTTTGVVLDDFEGGVRVTNGNKLWEMYTGETAVGTTSVVSAAARVGTLGMRANLTAGQFYMHFFPYDGFNWEFAHNKLTSGAWTRNTFDRMSFWIRHDANQPNDSGLNQKTVELGTYVRKELGDPTSQNDGGTHYYHFYNPLPGVWTYVVMDNHPQHAVGGPTTDPGVVTSPTTDGPTWNYIDALTRWYWNIPTQAPSAYPENFDFDQVTFYTDNVAEDVAHIASLECSYNPSTNLLHLGFVRNASEDASADTTYTANYAFSDIHTLGFSNASLMGTVGVDGQGDYVTKKIENNSLSLSGHSRVYIAVQKQGRSDFRQIYYDF